jgi:glutaredoxin-like protein NrdH
MTDKKVTMYTLSTCSHCKAAKRFFDGCPVRYEFTDIDMLTGEERSSIIAVLRELNPKCSVPTIVIGDRTIIGFDEDEIKEALGLS